MSSKLKFTATLGVVFLFASGAARMAYAAPPTNACSLLTQAQVSATLGVNVEAGRGIAPQVCSWPVRVRGAAPPKGARLNLVIPPAFAAAKKGTDYGVAKTIGVRGIGDDAVYTISTNPHEAPILTVKKGNAAFTIVVSGFSEDQAKAKEKALAIEVCSKL